jgi:Na+/proline symporter
MGWVFTGLIVAALVAQGKLDGSQLADHPERAFGMAIGELLKPGFVGLMAAAILASQMSTLSGQVVNSSALAAHNLFRGVIHPRATDKQVLITGRLLGIVIVTLAVLLANYLDTVAQGFITMIQVQTLTGLIIWAGVLWRRANAPGAWTAFVIMLAIYGSLGPLGSGIKDALTHFGVAAPTWVGQYAKPAFVANLMVCYVPAGLVALIFVSLVTPPVHPQKIADFFLLIRTPVGQEQKLIDAGVPIVYAGQTEPNYWETNHPHLTHWGGFFVAAAICAGILGVFYLLTRIGA